MGRVLPAIPRLRKVQTKKNLAGGEQAVVNHAIGLWRASAERNACGNIMRRMVETNTTTRVGFFLMDTQEQGGQHESRA